MNRTIKIRKTKNYTSVEIKMAAVEKAMRKAPETFCIIKVDAIPIRVLS